MANEMYFLIKNELELKAPPKGEGKSKKKIFFHFTYSPLGNFQ
jgi:hypothetical protein